MVVVALLALLVSTVAAGLVMWVGFHSLSMTERLHPPTPEQRRKRRQVYAVMVPVLLGSVLLGVLVAGAGGVVIVAAFRGGPPARRGVDAVASIPARQAERRSLVGISPLAVGCARARRIQRNFAA